MHVMLSLGCPLCPGSVCLDEEIDDAMLDAAPSRHVAVGEEVAAYAEGLSVELAKHLREKHGVGGVAEDQGT